MELLDFFPYEEPRESQYESMENMDKCIESNGIYTLEGACGTGKTLSALVPSIKHLKDDSSDPEQIFAVTSVKQQMKAFEDEVRRINNENNANVSALSLVGVNDLHPFVRQNIIDSDDYATIQQLRDGTNELVQSDIHNCSYRGLYKKSMKRTGDSYYSQRIPEENGIKYDPYYAKYRAEYDAEEDNSKEVIPFNVNNIGLITVDKLVSKSKANGYCPHSIMRLLIEHVDIIIGNYMHMFDQKTTKRITGQLINSKTIAIFDEAHNLVPRVRSHLSKDRKLTTFQRSVREIREIETLLEVYQADKTSIQNALDNIQRESVTENKSSLQKNIEKIIADNISVTDGNNIQKHAEEAYEILSKRAITVEDIQKYRSFLSELLDTVDNIIEKPIDVDETQPLQNPEDTNEDKISMWIDLRNKREIVKKALNIGEYIAECRSEISTSQVNTKTKSVSVSEFLINWKKLDNVHYYREIEFDERLRSSAYSKYRWQDDYSATLSLKCCVPKKEISQTISKLHSVVFMSATLKPMDVFTEITGIEDTERELFTSEFGLSFPRQNRETYCVTADKFTKANRKQAFNSFGASLEAETREQYYNAIVDIIENAKGKFLITMPSYKESEWIGTLLRKADIPNQIFIDQSSTYSETEEMLNKFFEQKNSILVTSSRGTVTEGIDYTGDKLHNVIVCGVPIPNNQSKYNTAIQNAYDELFGNGFNTAFVIPSVRKSRQAIGRVIRTNNDIGTRIFIDRRYCSTNWDGVYEYLSQQEQKEIEQVNPEKIGKNIRQFWEQQ